MGIPSYALLAKGLYKAAKDASKPIIALIAPRVRFEAIGPSAQEVLATFNQTKLLALQAELSPSLERARLENASYLGRQWTRILPTIKPYQLADPEAIEALRTRLLMPIKPLNQPCNQCGAIANIGHEDICKAAKRQWINRHNQITRAFIRTLSSRDDLKVEDEPNTSQIGHDANQLRADFSLMLGTSRYYYDVQIVAINKDSAKDIAYNTLTEAANEKRRKYKELGSYFYPLIFSAGGLMEKDTAIAYKALQKLLNPIQKQWLDNSIALVLTRIRANSALSIN